MQAIRNNDELAKELLFALARLRRESARLSSGRGLSGQERTVLFYLKARLDEGAEDVPIGDILSFLALSKEALSRTLGSLALKRLIVRRIAPGSARKRICRLTRQGLSFCRKDALIALEVSRTLLEELGEEDATSLIRIGAKIGNIKSKSLKGGKGNAPA